MSVRARRVAGEIQKAMGTVLYREHTDVTGDALVTVTEVEISPDLRNAKIFVSVIGSAAQAEKIISKLNDRSPQIRKSLSYLVYLRTIPALMFIVDETGEKVERISRLLNEWHAGQPNDPKRGE